MSRLSAFLNPVEKDEKKEVVISKRFLNEDGTPAAFVIRTITQAENNALIRRATRFEKGVETLDRTKYNSLIVLASVVEPNFADKEICDAYGVLDPAEVPARMLRPGEFTKLIEAISELNGFGGNEDLLDQAKN